MGKFWAAHREMIPAGPKKLKLILLHSPFQARIVRARRQEGGHLGSARTAGGLPLELGCVWKYKSQPFLLLGF